MKNTFCAIISKSWIPQRGCLALALSSMSVSAWAGPTTVELWRDMGISSALLGGGVAHITDASAADHNPAGIALDSAFFVSGEIGWTGQKLRQAEAATCESRSEQQTYAACVKFRQTQKVTGAMDRRYSLAIADSAGDGLFWGIGGDYLQLGRDRSFPAEPTELSNAQRARAGLVYVLRPGVSAGLYSDGLFDNTGYPVSHGAGLSARLDQYFLFNGDLHFDRDTLREMLVGATVFPKDFLDFAVSYGYDPKSSRHRFGGGVVVKSQQARLIYTLARSSEQTSQVLQTAGLSIFVSL